MNGSSMLAENPPGWNLASESGADEEIGSAAPAMEPARRPRWRRAATAIDSLVEWAFGALAVVLGLAVLSAIPVLQFLSFGYLLESAGRVARSGRPTDALIGIRKAARLGSMIAGCWLLLLPLRFVSSMASSAEIIEPGGKMARGWRVALAILTVLVVLHMVAACARGGKFRYFFWPLGTPGYWLRRVRQGGIYASSRDAVWDFVSALHLPYYFRVGLCGFLGTLAWLVVPVTLIAFGRRAPIVGFLGGLMLAIVALALPFLQMRFAAENRIRGLFEYRAIRDRFRRAPWAFAVASVVTLTFAVPLYLLKIELIPSETAWLPALVFLAFIVPARTLAAWAYYRSGQREQPRHWFFTVSTRLAVFPIGIAYAFIVFLTQYTAWQGIGSLYEQHAFLLPVPFVNM